MISTRATSEKSNKIPAALQLRLHFAGLLSGGTGKTMPKVILFSAKTSLKVETVTPVNGGTVAYKACNHCLFSKYRCHI